MTRRRVVITGMGTVCSVGIGWPEMWESLLAGKSGVGPIDHFDASKFGTRICARVRNFDPARWMDRKECKRVDRVSQLAIGAAELAREDGGIDFKLFDPNRVGVVLGTGIGGIEEIENEHHVLLQRGPDRMSPFTIPKLMANAMSGHLAIRYGLKGPNFVIGSACASSAHALALSGLLIRTGVVDMALSGGSEAAITSLGLGGFCSLRALSRRNDDPTTASRPFDKDRDGFVMGEGAGILILEEYEHAKARGAKIYAELAGWGYNDDAFHITQPAPEGAGAFACMKMALADAGITPDDVGYINAHGTSTHFNDLLESHAILRLFGERGTRLPVSSTKSMAGHLLGGAAAVESVATILTLHTGMAHPTINQFTPDPEIKIDTIPNQARRIDLRYAVKNSFGFGGHNACLVFGKI